jgi:arginine deiminase
MKTPEEQFDEKWEPRYKEHLKNSHNSPSPETRERLSTLETNHKNIMSLLEENKQEHKELRATLEDIKETLYQLPNILTEKFDERYADKKIEIELEKIKDKAENRSYEWLKYLITLILGAVVTIIISHYK